MLRTFKDFSDYHEYYCSHEQKDNDVDLVENVYTVCADGQFQCKSWKVALRRFFKAIAGDSRFSGWYDCIFESVESGYWKQIEPVGGYHWCVESIDEDLWYIELTVSK